MRAGYFRAAADTAADCMRLRNRERPLNWQQGGHRPSSELAIGVHRREMNSLEIYMQFRRMIRAGALCLLVGTIVPIYAQHEAEKENKAAPSQNKAPQPKEQRAPAQKQPQAPHAQPAKQAQAPRAQSTKPQQAQPQQAHQAAPPQPKPQQAHQAKPQQAKPQQAHQANKPLQPKAQQAHQAKPQQPKPQEAHQTQAPQQGHPTQQQASAWQQQRGWLKQGGGWQAHTTWQQNGDKNWNSDHRTWAQRGGYGGYFIPQDTYNLSFGSQHWFQLGSMPTVYMGYPRFSYGGFSFILVDPWPGSWVENWYAVDDVYIDYDGGYYLCNRSYPGIRLAIAVSL
jgi:hypothetical protein